jgi:hypothetical protein
MLRMSDLAVLANGSLSRLSRVRPAGYRRARNRADLHVVF